MERDHLEANNVITKPNIVQSQIFDGFQRVTTLRKVRSDQLLVYNKSKGAERARLDRNIAATEMEIVEVMQMLSKLSPTEVNFLLQSDIALCGLLEARNFKAPWMEFD